MVRIVEAREKTIGLSSGARNAHIAFTEMTASAVVLVSDVMRGGKPICGLAFDSIGRYAHGSLLRERFFPRLLAAAPNEYAGADGGIDPAKAWNIVMRNEKGGGHGERAGAVGLIDAALWDLQAKLERKPLWRLLQERFAGDVRTNAASRVPVYASGGHYRDGDEIAGLKDEIGRGLDLGYRRFKIKIGAAPLAQDRTRIEGVLALLGDGARLAVDCNAALTRDTASAWLGALSAYRLAWIEEPVDPLDYALHGELASVYDGALATGENIFSAADTRNLLRHGGLRRDRDLLNMDISLSYGIVEYLRILDLLAEHGWPRTACLPHAGHLLALHVSAGLGLGGHETAPLHELIGGFPPDVTVADGYVTPGDSPGVGLEFHQRLAPVFSGLMH